VKRVGANGYVRNPVLFQLKLSVRSEGCREFRTAWEKIGVAKRVGVNRYMRNPFWSQCGFRMGRAQWKNYIGSGGKYVDEEMTRELLEGVRGPDGPICPHCVVVGGHYRVNPRKGSKRSVRQGVWKSRDCRKQFTVTVGTVFQGSKIPLNKWVTAIYLIADSAKIVNVHELHRRLGLT